MINAESFRKKSKDIEDKEREVISGEIQKVLEVEMSKDVVQIPCNLVLKNVSNVKLIKEEFTKLGFNCTIKIENTNYVEVQIDYQKLEMCTDEDLIKTLQERYKIPNPYLIPPYQTNPYIMYGTGTGAQIIGSGTTTNCTSDLMIKTIKDLEIDSTGFISSFM